MNNLVKALIIVAIVVGAVVGFLNWGGGDKPDVSSGGGTKASQVAGSTDKTPAKPSKPIPGANVVQMSISGVVRNDQDQIVSAATVYAYETSGSVGQTEMKLAGEVKSSNVGEFTFDLRPGMYEFIARYPGYREGRATRTLIEGQTPKSIEFVLSSGLTISGRVLGLGGEGIAGASVSVFLERAEENATLQDSLILLLKLDELKREEAIIARSDANGYYQLEGLEDTSYRMRVLASGHAPAGRRYVRAGSRDVDFSLNIGGQLTGTVLSSDGGALSGAGVYVYRQQTEDIIEVVLQRLYPPIASTTSDSSGGYVFDQLGGGGEYRIVATAAGHQPREIEKVVVQTGGDTPLDLTLSVGNTITGIVYDPSGAPLHGARVKANLTGARSQSTQLSLTDEGVLTDADGRFGFDTLEGGEYRVVASHEEYATFQQQKVKPDSAELSISLTEGGAIGGMVRDSNDGSPIAGAVVKVQDIAGIEKKATSDGSGRYLVRGVSVPKRGEARLGCEAEGYAREGNARSTVAEGQLSDGVDFAMRKNGIVSGVVLDSLGKRVSGARVEVKRQNDPSMPISVTVGGPVRSGSDGSYTIENVAPGEANFVLASHREYLDIESEPFDLAPDGRVDGIEVALRMGGAISGVVVDDQNQPLEGATVAIKDERMGDVPLESLEKQAKADASGAYTIRSIEAGDATLVAHLDGYLRIEISGITVVEGRTTEGMTIHLTQGASLSGYIVDSDDQPIVGVKVTVIDTSEGLNKPTRRTDSNGFYEFNELGRFPVQVNLEKQGYSKDQRHEVPVNTENNNFVLRRLGTLVGTAINQHGEPLKTFSVAPKVDQDGRQLQRQPPRTFNTTDGRFEYPGVNSGTYTIVLGCPGFAATTLESIVVQEDLVTDLGNVTLYEGGKTAGVVIDKTTGAPVFGATIHVKGSTSMLSNPFTGNRGGGRPVRRGGQANRSRTDKNGAYMIEGLAEDVVTVEITHRNFMKLHVELRAGEMDAEILLSRGGIIEGEVLSASTGAGLPGIQLFLTGNGASSRQVTDRKGSFTFSGLEDGEYQVRATTFGLVGANGGSIRDAEIHTVVVRNAAAEYLTISYAGEVPDKAGGGRGNGRGN